ncbi:hypothetical protein GCM10023081_30980 [Arthrobacter ginkgonis]|uniref:Uncharacterized protein n=1 Tax=Arthrobacter ginkgonis TaxID=1630594 RepID=A0ABP7CLX3_9MICC
MAGMAVDTIVVSTRIMKKPMATAHRAPHAALLAFVSQGSADRAAVLTARAY